MISGEVNVKYNYFNGWSSVDQPNLGSNNRPKQW